MEPYIVGQDRSIQKKAQMISEALRAAPGLQTRSDSTFYIPANGASPARIVNNERGQMWNNIKDAVAVTGALGDVYNAEQDKKDQSIALSQAAEDTGAMTPQKMMQLRNLGVDVETIKLMQGDKPDRLGQNQILQYGQTPAGMRAVNQLKPGTFSDEAIQAAAEAERAAHAQDVADKRELAIAGRAPSEPRARTELDVLMNGTDEERQRLESFKLVTSGRGVYDQSGKVVPKPVMGRGGKAPIDPKAELAKHVDMTNQLEAMLNDPRSKDELFSTKQAIIVPAGEAAKAGDNPGVFGTLIGQAARGQKSPMATELDRWGQKQALVGIKELYPASNADIAMLLSMQAKAGDSRANMESYLKQRRLVESKIASGDIKPNQQQDGADSLPENWDLFSPEEQAIWLGSKE